MARYDYYSPSMAATIITSGGDRIPLWMANAQNQGGGGDGTVDRPFLQEVTVKLNMGGAPVITARLTPSYEQGIAFLDSHLSEWGDSQLEVLLGYTTGPDGQNVIGPPYTGLLLKPEIQIGSDISITLNAQGVGSFNLHTGAGTTVLRGKRNDIIQTLLRQFDENNQTQIELDVDEVQNGEGVDDDIKNAMFNDDMTVACSGRTPWQIIFQLAWEIRCYMIFEGNKLRIFPRSVAHRRRQRYTLTCYHQYKGSTGPGSGYLPILSASSPTLGIYLAQGNSAMGSLAINSSSRQMVVNTVNPAQTVSRTSPGSAGTDRSAQAPGASQNAAQNGNGIELVPSEDAETLRTRQAQALKAEAEERANNAGIKLELETLGAPDIIPGDTVSVYGLGRRIDSRRSFLVMVVTHTMGTGGMTTKLELISNVDALSATQLTEVEGPVQTNQPDPLGDQERAQNAAVTMVAREVRDLGSRLGQLFSGSGS